MVTKPAPSNLDEELTIAFSSQRRQLQAITARANPDDREDLLQDAVVRLIESERRTPVLKPIHLLRRILRNLAIDHLRARTRTSRLFSAGEAPNVASDRPDAEHHVVVGQRLRRALAVIDTMPDRRRTVFLMHRVEELTHLQIARRLGISTKTVEKHIGLAMVQLSRETDRE
jgi:RNA polymerase sigma factor (sigma-70 family)